ncbi:hypothetical protein H310_06629 [Aphanomyces invadans]|uniref:BAP29/BAP31 transmembrane domain-containing protein n=1 Tax=Aphanomyces invadans TaxID=157072 RepID=A0A024U3K6_9STRA|nr:hypothetical protein H310_06629 [Aphanomyces invadans]ETW00986.1 hypothetical protein H310_06629 [Aphanomyces invadans]|eukprot:XP_008869984.1 hypothetical protein H310_06629 [Aphanomyces invadans]
MTIWAAWAYVLLPPAVILLILLTIPFPRPVAKGVVRMNEFILNFHIASIPVFSVITGLAFVALAGQTYDLQKRYNYQITGIEKHYEADLQHRATRWRSERNWWISALTFTIYWMLMAFQSMKKQLLLASRRTD